ncbi:MAG: sodium:proton antiporter [Methanospirillum sp.]|nr:sodium:proton antiporter [Methanospirillum sp.]
MSENLIIANEIIIIALLLVAILASLILRRLRMPYTIGLVIIGYAFAEFIVPHISAFEPLQRVIPAVDIILYIFLPPLIFESAVALNTRLLSRNLFPVLCLAIFGVIISAGIIGYLVAWYFAIPLLFALLFGALISSTDPVAVISIFKEIGVPRRLQTLVEGESLLNDAASIILFQLVLLLIRNPIFKNEHTFLETSTLFTTQLLTSFAGGIVIGIISGFLLRMLLKRAPLHAHIHQTATLVAAYLTYLISDEAGFSGVIAVVACGFFTARAASDCIGPDRREDLARFWEYIGFLANSLIFLLVGIAIASLEDLSIMLKGGILGILFLIAATLLARFVPVFGIFGLYNLFTTHRVPLSYQTVCFWGGLRGAVAIALFLSIPLSLPFRDLIIAFSVTIVLFTIFVQGITMGPLIRALGLGQSGMLRRFHQLHADLVTSRVAQERLKHSVLEGIISPGVLEECASRYREISTGHEQKIRELWDEIHKNTESVSILRLFWLEAIRFEQKLYRHLYDDGLILPQVFAELQYQATIREDLIQSGNYHPVVLVYTPGSRFRMRMKGFVSRISPDSRLSGFLEEKSTINRIFAAIAIVVTASATTRYMKDLSSRVCLDPGEIADILAEYDQACAEETAYLRSVPVAGSRALKEVSRYLAKRTAGAGMILLIHQYLEEGSGDEKILTGYVNQLIREKNTDEKKLIRKSSRLFP